MVELKESVLCFVVKRLIKRLIQTVKGPFHEIQPETRHHNVLSRHTLDASFASKFFSFSQNVLGFINNYCTSRSTAVCIH